MSRHPQQPHMFAFSVDGNAPAFIVVAMSFAEAWGALREGEIASMEKLTPARAFAIGKAGTTQVFYAKPEYAEGFTPQGDLDLAAVGIPDGRVLPAIAPPAVQPADTADTNEA